MVVFIAVSHTGYDYQTRAQLIRFALSLQRLAISVASEIANH